MQTPIDWAILFAFVSVALAAGINSYRYLKESEYIKNKYKAKGYRQGWKEAKEFYSRERN